MMTRLLPCFTVAAVATATATTTRVTMDDEPAFFAAALARDDAAARWRAEASAANVRALGVAPGRVVLLFAAPALSEEARALAALGYRVEAYDLVGDAAADVELRLVDRFLGDLGRGEGVVFFRPGAAFTRLPGPVGALVAPPTPSAAAVLDAAGGDAWAAACGAFAAWSAVAKAWPSTQVCRDTVRAREARGAGRWGLPFAVRGARLPRGLFADAAAAQDARSETVCGARCFVRERFTHVNITDVALEGTTESTRREAPGVAEREGPCAALCPGG